MAVAVEEQVAEDVAAALTAVCERLRPRFMRAEPRRRARRYLEGLLGGAGRKNGWQLAEAAGAATPYGMQRLLAGSGWDAEAARDDLRGYVTDEPRQARSSNSGKSTLGHNIGDSRVQ